MKSITVLATAAVTIILTTTLFAEDDALRSADPNEIFNSIMQTMPGDMKEQIDSATTTQRTMNGSERFTHASHEEVRQPAAVLEARQANIDKLPESVREQVRKTMQELEQGNAERMLQFKETQNQHKDK